MNIFSWRHAIQKSNLQSTTKLVLLNLSIYMNDRGESCFPTIKQQMQDTGLSNRVVCLHISKAVDAGFLIKDKHGYSGQKWANNEYKASFPKGSDAKSSPCEKVVTLMTEGSDFNDKKVVTQSHTNSSYNSPNKKKSDYKKIWNDFAKQNGLAGIRGITENRMKKLNQRIKEGAFENILEEISKSSFLKGQNSRQWAIDFDWLLKPENYNKVLEGKYRDKEKPKHTGLTAKDLDNAYN